MCSYIQGVQAQNWDVLLRLRSNKAAGNSLRRVKTLVHTLKQEIASNKSTFPVLPSLHLLGRCLLRGSEKDFGGYQMLPFPHKSSIPMNKPEK